MSSQFIVPITPMTSISGIGSANPAAKSAAEQNGTQSFASILENAIATVRETSSIEAVDAYNLATANTDELHNLQINQQKAYLAIELLQSVRNKVLDSYKEIMSMNI